MLDLVLTDVNDMMQITALPDLADHCVVCIDMSVDIGRTEISLRDVWDFRRADWDGLKVALKECRWESFWMKHISTIQWKLSAIACVNSLYASFLRKVF